MRRRDLLRLVLVAPLAALVPWHKPRRAPFTSDWADLLQMHQKRIYYAQYKAYEDRFRIAGLGQFRQKPEGKPWPG